MSNEAFLHGQRAEALFEMIAASLGEIQILKREDEGEVYYSLPREVQPPDFRLILKDGSQALVEVKNFYQRSGTEPHEHSVEYVDKLVAYAEVMKCELFFATYWVGWNTWTLVRERHLEREGNRRVLTFVKANMFNEMALLGDKRIGTRSPLRFRVETVPEPEKKPRRTKGEALMVKSVGLLSEDREITDPTEIRIATFLLFYGNWNWGESEQVTRDAVGGISSVEYTIAPDPEGAHQEKQGFEFIGTLSGMLSRLYRSKTTKAGKIIGIRADFVPGEMGNFIPEGFHYKRSALPLWVFIITPQKDAQGEPVKDAGE